MSSAQIDRKSSQSYHLQGAGDPTNNDAFYLFALRAELNRAEKPARVCTCAGKAADPANIDAFHRFPLRSELKVRRKLLILLSRGSMLSLKFHAIMHNHEIS